MNVYRIHLASGKSIDIMAAHASAAAATYVAYCLNQGLLVGTITHVTPLTTTQKV